MSRFLRNLNANENDDQIYGGQSASPQSGEVQRRQVVDS
jgi:hypothetical protein